jgi:hypothetical protein
VLLLPQLLLLPQTLVAFASHQAPPMMFYTANKAFPLVAAL